MLYEYQRSVIAFQDGFKFHEPYSQVERVACTKSGTTLLGTIHLTAHHLIFRYNGEAEKEMWVSKDTM